MDDSEEKFLNTRLFYLNLVGYKFLQMKRKQKQLKVLSELSGI